MPIQPVSVVSHHGIDETMLSVEDFFGVNRATMRASLRAEQRRSWFETAMHQELMNLLLDRAATTAVFSEIREKSVSGALPPTVAVHRLLAHLQLTISEQL